MSSSLYTQGISEIAKTASQAEIQARAQLAQMYNQLVQAQKARQAQLLGQLYGQQAQLAGDVLGAQLAYQLGLAQMWSQLGATGLQSATTLASAPKTSQLTTTQTIEPIPYVEPIWG